METNSVSNLDETNLERLKKEERISEKLKNVLSKQNKFIKDEETGDLKRKLRVAIYVRVSTEEQAKNGYSIPAQLEKLSDFSLLKDYYIVDLYIDEGKSGKDIDGRDEAKRMLKDVNDDLIDVVLVYKLDRLTRSVRDLINLVDIFNENKCEFVSFMENIDTQTATGRMFIKIIGIFAEFERENLIERISVALEKKVKDGYTLATWVTSYGYDLPKGCKVLQINDVEKEIVQYVFDCFTEKCYDE
ncbi:recombinase family protein [Ruminococcaceae bacterium OttesenSCG-928-L11]|nr:recombinase family protein [Ruminococcaceae bacterium OttesenSCG-928-L11]